MTLTVKDVAARFGVSEHTVLTWIRAGELKALNVGRSPGAKSPRWRITLEAVEAFELLRSHVPPAPQARRRRQPTDVIQRY